MSIFNKEELNLLSGLVQAAQLQTCNSEALATLARKLELEALKEPGEPDLWVSEQHGSLVSVRGYETPDTSVYKNWKKAQFLAD